MKDLLREESCAASCVACAPRNFGRRPESGFVAKRLLLKLHSATGLIDRLEKQRLVTRHSSEADRPRAQLEFTPAALDVLASPLAAHKDEIMRPSPWLDQLLARFPDREKRAAAVLGQDETGRMSSMRTPSGSAPCISSITGVFTWASSTK